MSFCPTKDIHSVYLDNEMPLEYKAEYEAHVNSCAECKKVLSELKAVHLLLQADSEAITPDAEFLDESYERLQLKLKYSKTSRKSYPKIPAYRMVYGLSAVAAAAVFVVMLPVKLKTSKVQNSVVNTVQNVGAVNPIVGTSTAMRGPVSPYNSAVNNVSFGGTGKGVVISGNIHESVLSPYGRKPMLQEINSQKMARNLMKDVDVIKPDLGDKTISIRITVPGFNTVPVTTEIDLPVNVMSGFVE